MTHGNSPISAIVQTNCDPYGAERLECSDSGLTKREYFAAMAMQGICANLSSRLKPSEAAETSVKIADALIQQLNQK
jgi:hypothetical protein